MVYTIMMYPYESKMNINCPAAYMRGLWKDLQTEDGDRFYVGTLKIEKNGEVLHLVCSWEKSKLWDKLYKDCHEVGANSATLHLV